MSSFNRILIANRGEIACRIISTAQSLGYYCIAIYSDADANAPHKFMADEAVAIGAAPVNESYLNIDAVLAAATVSNAQAIHPGYGFLSENAEFAAACQQAKIVFIGPSSRAIQLMGNKAESKRLMLDANVPCVPGYQGFEQDDATLIAAANEIGYPVMIKAAAGGGGRGMRQVTDQGSMSSTLSLARNEALNAFGNDELIIEKTVINPRHVEIQIFADQHGNIVHLGERDCSVQRRHQKIIEEAPCPVMSDELRHDMGQAAIRVAQSVDYYGAGTVEFLLNTEDNQSFYFLEMNTRLQVEHPVTEMITGLDLVALQIQVAQDQPLGFTQEDIEFFGHAIEVRLYAEDCANGFLPASGNIAYWQQSDEDNIRTDSGIETGLDISPFYDPMVAKIIAWGADRHQAQLKLLKALRQTQLFGTTTNREFLIDCLQQDECSKGNANTGFIERHYPNLNWSAVEPSPELVAIVAVLEVQLGFEQSQSQSLSTHQSLKHWNSINWNSTSQLSLVQPYAITSGNGTTQQYKVSLYCDSLSGNNDTQQYKACVDDNTNHVITIRLLTINHHDAELIIGNSIHHVYFHADHTKLYLSYNDASFTAENLDLQLANDQQVNDGSAVIAPMHGVILELLVKPGDNVEAGQPVAILEAMKMHHQICVERAATVQSVCTAQGKQVAANDILIELN